MDFVFLNRPMRPIRLRRATQPSRVSNVAGYPPHWMLEQALLLSIHFRVASSVQPGTAKPGVATP
jgi:hypothetical protein